MIQKRGNNWGVRVYVARTGKQKWLGTFPTKREARRAEREALSSPIATADESCASFASRWVEDFPRPRASTNRHNGYAAKRFATDFGTRRMSDVTRAEAYEWATRQRSSASAIRAMFSDAMNVGTVAANPFANLRLAQSRGRKDLVPLTEADVHELADQALISAGTAGPTMRAAILFAAYVGLRPAEMFLLRWADIDFAAGRVHIRRSLGVTGEITLPKNGKARTVVLPPPVADALRSMPRRSDSPLVFTTQKGTGFTKTTHYYHWRTIRIEAGHPKMAFYELRHFCATRLLELGLTPADVAVQLGHTDGGVLVMSTYGHPSEDAARERIAAAFTTSPARLRVVNDEGAGAR